MCIKTEGAITGFQDGPALNAYPVVSLGESKPMSPKTHVDGVDFSSSPQHRNANPEQGGSQPFGIYVLFG